MFSSPKTPYGLSAASASLSDPGVDVGEPIAERAPG